MLVKLVAPVKSPVASELVAIEFRGAMYQHVATTISYTNVRFVGTEVRTRQTGPVGRLRLSDDRLFVGLPCLDPHVTEVCGVIVLISFVVNRKSLYGGKKVFIRNFGHQPGDSC
jgi:hypothetical protein